MKVIYVLRKPLTGTVAANVLKHGVGGLNIDATRIGSEVRYNPIVSNKAGGSSLNMSVRGMPQDTQGRMAEGRWPANLILGSDLAHDPDVFPVTKGVTWCRTDGARPFNNAGADTGHTAWKQDDTEGSAARYFKIVGDT